MVPLRLAWLFTKPYWRHYAVGFLAILGASFLVMFPPLILGRAIDELRDGASGGEGPSTGRLLSFGAVILVLAAFEGFLRFGSRLLVSGTSRRVEYDIRLALAAHLMKLDQAFFLRSQTGDLMARCTNDLQMVRDVVGPTLIDLLRTTLMLIFGFIFLLTINVRLALFAYAYFPIVAVAIAACSTVVEARYRAVQDQFGVLATHVQENVSGVRTVKAYAQEDTEVGTFERANGEMLRRSMAWTYWTSALWPLMIVGTGASSLLVLWFGGHDVAAGRMTLGEFVQFNAYLVLLANPLTSLGWTATALQAGVASLRRIVEVLGTTPTIEGGVTPIEAVRGDLSFRDVSFSYGGKPVLDHFSLDVPAGSVVALVGVTGSGKSTVVNLLGRLWDPEAGSIHLDGHDLRELPLDLVRASVGVVPQETFLFSDSLRENIAYGHAAPSVAEMQFAVETSQLSNDFPQLTFGLETIIGERGVTLSGGQKQRTAIARAIIKAPPILVLDDALSHVDTRTEEEILRRLRGFMAGRTTLLIAHRTSTVAAADRIVVLERGRIVESGSHDELLSLGEVYARFYRCQLLVEQLGVDVEDEEVTP